MFPENPLFPRRETADGAKHRHMSGSAEKTVHAPAPGVSDVSSHLSPPPPPLGATRSSNKDPGSNREMRDDPARAHTDQRGGHYAADQRHVGMHPVGDLDTRRRIAEQAAEVMGLKHAKCARCGHWWCYSQGPDPYVCPCCTDPDHIAPWLYVAREDLA
jgi:hypothetical protein